MSIQVVGAGFGRSGTNSLRLALNELGVGPCYHMYECLENGDAPSWLLAEDAVRADCGVSLAGALQLDAALCAMAVLCAMSS